MSSITTGIQDPNSVATMEARRRRTRVLRSLPNGSEITMFSGSEKAFKIWKDSYPSFLDTDRVEGYISPQRPMDAEPIRFTFLNGNCH